MAKAERTDTGYVYITGGKAYPVYENKDHVLFYDNGKTSAKLTADMLASQSGGGRLQADPNKEQKMSTQAAQSTYNAGLSLKNAQSLITGLTNPISGLATAFNSINGAYNWLTGTPNTQGVKDTIINSVVPNVGGAIDTAKKALGQIGNYLGEGNVQDYIDATNATKSNTSTADTAADLSASIIDAALGSYTKPNYLNGSGGVGVASANQPRLMSAAELASLYGINYDYDYILGILNDASDAYYNEVTEKAKKLQEDTLRNQVNLYYQYLNAMREQRANAVNTGMNRGAQAAQEVAQYLAHQQQITNALSESNSGIYDLYNEAATKRMENRVSALDKYNSLGTALMTAGANFNANDVQRYAADMSAASQAAYANAYQNAAALNAQANIDSAYMNSYLNPANSALLKAQLLNYQNASNLNNAQINYYNAQANALKNNK